MLESAIMSCFWLLVFVYLWPLRINPDTDRDLPIWYPFTSSYWFGQEPNEEEGDLTEPLLEHYTNPSQS